MKDEFEITPAMITMAIAANTMGKRFTSTIPSQYFPNMAETVAGFAVALREFRGMSQEEAGATARFAGQISKMLMDQRKAVAAEQALRDISAQQQQQQKATPVQAAQGSEAAIASDGGTEL